MRPTLLFDLDGTLIDSAADLAAALNRLLGRFDRPPLPVDRVRGFMGDGAEALVAREFVAAGGTDGVDLAGATAEFRDDYDRNATALTRPYPGVIRTLTRLADAGLAMGICTNKPLAPTLTVLAALDLERFFRAVVGGDEPARRKPDRAHPELALARLGATATDAVLVGDSEIDLGAASAAGLPSVLCAWGCARDPAAARLAATRVIDRFDALPDALGSLGFGDL